MKRNIRSQAPPAPARSGPRVRRRSRLARRFEAVLTLLLCLPPASCLSQEQSPAPLRLTLAEALRMAAAADPRLPVAATGVEIARQGLRAARARLYPGLSVDGDLHEGAPADYASGDARLQLVAVDTLYAGSSLRAGRRLAESEYRSAGAQYRTSQKDVALETELSFTEALRNEREVVIRSEGIVRLRSYVIWLEARHAAGEGVSADLLSARVRVNSEEASIADAERSLDKAEMELDQLIGRDPRAELELVPMPPPSPPSPAEGEPWLETPEVQRAAFDSAAAREAIASTRAERRPLLWASANAGWEPTFGPQGAPLNTGTGAGVEGVIGLTLPIFDFGLHRAHLEQAELLARQARESLVLERRQARLSWARAMKDLQDLFRLYQLRAENVPLARDSYLEAESVYRGGAGTALEVLDAYSSWIDAQIAEADAAMRYRQAEAQRTRWGTP